MKTAENSITCGTELDGIVRLFVERRFHVGVILSVVGALFFALSVHCVLNSSPPPAPVEEQKVGEEKKETPLRTSREIDFLLGAICSGLSALISLGTGGHMLGALPRPTERERQITARYYILLAFGLLGMVLMVSSLAYFLSWISSLKKLLDSQELSEGKWVLGPVLGLLVGAGMVFFGMIPARADERNNTTLRRFIYSVNFGLNGFLLLTILLIVNILVTLRVPNKLDTTAAGVHSITLAEDTKNYITGLDKTVEVITFFIGTESDDPASFKIVTDTKALLAKCAALNPERFLIKHLTVLENRKEYESLAKKYPILTTNLGILVRLQDDDKRSGFVKLTELLHQEFDRDAKTRSYTYEGEPKLVRELLAVSDSSTSPVVYVTQSSGEIAFFPEGASLPGARNGLTLRTRLEKSGCRVLALTPDLTGEVKIPDDATTVIVADPTAPLNPRLVESIRNFLQRPRPGTKKGHLVVLTSAQEEKTLPNEPRRIAATGLEPLLAEYSLELKSNVVYGLQTADFSTGAEDGVDAYKDGVCPFEGFQLLFTRCREMKILVNTPRSATRVKPLFNGIEKQSVWKESTFQDDPARIADELRSSREVQQAKGLEKGSALVYGAYVTEEDSPRMVVFNTGHLFENDARARGVAGQLLDASVNWLRERPKVANVTGKTFGLYRPRNADELRQMKYLPLSVVSLVTIVFGVGTWIFRKT